MAAEIRGRGTGLAGLVTVEQPGQAYCPIAPGMASCVDSVRMDSPSSRLLRFHHLLSMEWPVRDRVIQIFPYNSVPITTSTMQSRTEEAGKRRSANQVGAPRTAEKPLARRRPLGEGGKCGGVKLKEKDGASQRGTKERGDRSRAHACMRLDPSPKSSLDKTTRLDPVTPLASVSTQRTSE